jgi:hypothetical protein
MTIHTELRTLLTAITEAAVEQVLLRDLQQLGIKAYTISDARGRGMHGLRDGAWGKSANIRVEMILPRQQAESTLLFLQEHYFANFAMVAYLQDVEVIRAEKF